MWGAALGIGRDRAVFFGGFLDKAVFDGWEQYTSAGAIDQRWHIIAERHRVGFERPCSVLPLTRLEPAALPFLDHACNPQPNSLTLDITGRKKFVCSPRCLDGGVFAVPLDENVTNAPDVDVG
jgi:hypothetical protein